jgi:ATP-dependent Clp protease adaptor protein ClpS
MSDTITQPKTDTNSEVRTERQPPYAVILYNDDINTMDWVIIVLQKVFSYNVEKCVQLMLDAHNTGRTVVWVGAMELAELKAEQIVSCGPDPQMKAKKAQPLRVSIEPTA